MVSNPALCVKCPNWHLLLNPLIVGSNVPIAVFTLFVSDDEHVNTLFQKLGAANRAEAVAIALRKQLLKI